MKKGILREVIIEFCTGEKGGLGNADFGFRNVDLGFKPLISSLRFYFSSAIPLRPKSL